MGIEDFFSKVDSSLGNASDATADPRITATKNRAFLEEVVSRLIPLVETYKGKLEERGIHVEVDNHPTSINFVMYYEDGCHRGLHIGGLLENNRIAISTSFVNDDGKQYTSTDGDSYDRSNWDDSIYESRMQKSIEDFLFYADSHGRFKD